MLAGPQLEHVLDVCFPVIAQTGLEESISIYLACARRTTKKTIAFSRLSIYLSTLSIYLSTLYGRVIGCGSATNVTATNLELGKVCGAASTALRSVGRMSTNDAKLSESIRKRSRASQPWEAGRGLCKSWASNCS